MKHLRFMLIVILVIIIDVMSGGAASSSHLSLSGADAAAFLQEADFTSQHPFSISHAYPPQGREFFFTRQAGAVNAGDDDRFGISVALDSNTMLVGAQLNDIGPDMDQGSVYFFELENGRWVQKDYVTVADGEAGDRLGFSVALDGDTALVGAHLADIDGSIDQGAVYVFVRQEDDTWSQQDKLVAGDGIDGDEFGYALALDGNTALVGARFADVDGAADQGAAYLFNRSGNSWTQETRLTANDGAPGDELGTSVAIEGGTALLGAPSTAVNGMNFQGAAYIFSQNTGGWQQQPRLTAGDGLADDQFGMSVALSGSTALIGAPTADTFGALGNDDQGAAYFFTKQNNTWGQQDKVTIFGDEDDRFGRSVDIEGDTAIIGSPRRNFLSKNNQGAAYIFTRQNGAWSQQNELIVNKGFIGDFTGRSVAISGDIAAAGAPQGAYNGQTDVGVVHTFARSPLAWHLAAEHIDEDGQEGERYGFDVDLDGERVIVGSRSAEKVFIYVRSDAGWMLEDTLTPSIGSGGDQFGYSVALDGDQALVGARGTSFNGDDNRGVAYIFRRSGSDWAEEQLLIASDGAEDDQFGHAVALDGSTALIGAPGSQFNFNDDQGQVYVFTQDVGGWSMQDKFNTNDMDEVNRFGSSLDVDGDTAVIGAALSVVDSNISQGLAFVFERQGGNWNQSKRLDQPLGSGDAFDFFGTSVAIDGDTLLVGASGVQAHNEIDEGIVYSYFRRDNSWLPHLSTMVIPFDESQPFDAFGTSVDLQGNTAIVGARGADTSGVSKGTAYLFSLINGIWIEQARFMILAGQEFDLFGSAVALDGQTVLIGAEGVDFAGDDSRGKAFLFERQPYELFQPMVIAE